MLGVAPERLNAVDMPGSLDELIVAVVDPKVLFQADVNQAIVARPTVGMNDAVGVNFASNNGLQRGFGGIGDDFGIDNSCPRLSRLKMMILPPAPGPRLLRTRLGSK